MKPIIGIAANERPMIEEAEHWLSYTPKNFVTHIQQAQGIPYYYQWVSWKMLRLTSAKSINSC